MAPTNPEKDTSWSLPNSNPIFVATGIEGAGISNSAAATGANSLLSDPALTRAAVPANRDSLGVGIDRHQIEPLRRRLQPTHRSPYGSNLVVGELLHRGGTHFHLDRDNNPAVSDDQVDLTATGTYIASEYRAAPPGKETGSDLFADVA